MVRCRSEQNRLAISCCRPLDMLSPVISILRQELDSMIRVIYLLLINDLSERERLIQQTLNGERWKTKTSKGKWENVTDRKMVKASQNFQSWTKSVYEFGCSFIHLSHLHDSLAENPFKKLPQEEQRQILSHMRFYHQCPMCDHPSMEELASYIPRVFEKISDNLECYLKNLEQNKTINGD